MPKKVNFNFSKIETLQFATFDSKYNKDKEIEFGLNTEFVINDVDKSINVNEEISFFQNKYPFIKIEVSCLFKIEEISWSTFLNENKIIIPVDFARHLLMLTVGTSRGILHAKIENKQFKDIVLPTINLADIIKEDISFEIQKK